MSTKNITYYATTASRHADNHLPVGTGFHATCHPFTKEENDLYKILSQNRSKSIWGYSIKDVCKGVRVYGDVARFRKLIECLISQAKDCAETMKLIIGEDGYKALMAVKNEAFSVGASAP